MLNINPTPRPVWTEVLPGIEIELRPVTRAVMRQAGVAFSKVIVGLDEDDETGVPAAFDAFRDTLLQAVIADWKGIADLAGKPLPSLLLMPVAWVLSFEALEKTPPSRTRHERQAHLDIRALEPRGLFLHKSAHQPVHEGIGRLEARHEKLLQAGLDVAGEQ